MRSRMLRTRTLLSCAAVLLATAPIALAGGGRIAIKVGRIITQAGPDIVNGVIVIEDGRITSVGPDEKAPWNLRRVVHLHRRAGFAATWDELQRDLKAIKS